MLTLPFTQYVDITVVQILLQGVVALGAIKPMFPYSSSEDSGKVQMCPEACAEHIISACPPLPLYLALYPLADNPTLAPALAARHQRNLDTLKCALLQSEYRVASDSLPVLFRCDIRYKVADNARLFTTEIKKKFESARSSGLRSILKD